MTQKEFLDEAIKIDKKIKPEEVTREMLDENFAYISVLSKQSELPEWITEEDILKLYNVMKQGFFALEKFVNRLSIEKLVELLESDTRGLNLLKEDTYKIPEIVQLCKKHNVFNKHLFDSYTADEIETALSNNFRWIGFEDIYPQLSNDSIEKILEKQPKYIKEIKYHHQTPKMCEIAFEKDKTLLKELDYITKDMLITAMENGVEVTQNMVMRVKEELTDDEKLLLHLNAGLTLNFLNTRKIRT
jgi:hypothetical protein